MHCYGEQRTIAQTNVWFVNPHNAKFKSNYSELTRWKFDCSQYSFVLLPLKQGALTLIRWQTNSKTFAPNHHRTAQTLNSLTRMQQLVISKCTILSRLLLSPLSITVTCFDTKWLQRYNAAHVLIIDYSFNFFIIPYTTEIDILGQLMKIITFEINNRLKARWFQLTPHLTGNLGQKL